MPTPAAPIAQLIQTGSGRAAVYGPTVQARHDAAVFHSLGYDAGDLIRQSAEQAALQRELDRQVALRPMAPLLHPAATGAPVRGGDQTNDFYDEDDFELPPTPSRAPTNTFDTHSTCPCDRYGQGNVRSTRYARRWR
jgi:hypothetical protein